MTNVAEIKFDNAKFTALLDGSVAANARKLGISRQHLNNIVRGHKQPSANLLLKIQHIFKISPEMVSKMG